MQSQHTDMSQHLPSAYLWLGLREPALPLHGCVHIRAVAHIALNDGGFLQAAGLLHIPAQQEGSKDISPQLSCTSEGMGGQAIRQCRPTAQIMPTCFQTDPIHFFFDNICFTIHLHLGNPFRVWTPDSGV